MPQKNGISRSKLTQRIISNHALKHPRIRFFQDLSAIAHQAAIALLALIATSIRLNYSQQIHFPHEFDL
jgi:hypothetical protein